MTAPVVVVDTGPIASAFLREGALSALAQGLLGRLRRSAWVPDPVAVEVDLLLRRRGDAAVAAARSFWAALDAGLHRRLPMNAELWRRAAEIDRRFADLNLGAVDAAVAAAAASFDAPILTWDFRDFRAVTADLGLALLADESDLR